MPALCARGPAAQAESGQSCFGIRWQSHAVVGGTDGVRQGLLQLTCEAIQLPPEIQLCGCGRSIVVQEAHQAPVSTGRPAARHSGKPSSSRRTVKPRSRNAATASKDSTQ